MMTGCCPFCGAEYALAESGCWDCKTAFEEPPPPTLAPDQPDDEVVYELDDWSVAARTQLTTTLAERGIAARWEPGLTIAVREVDDEATENLLDELEESAVVDYGEDEDGGTEAGAEGEAEDDGSVAQAAMADLFVAADRLMGKPDDEVVAAELGAAAAIVDDSRPPFGIESELWDRVRELSTNLCGVVDARAGDDAVVDAARALRDVLRPYV